MELLNLRFICIEFTLILLLPITTSIKNEELPATTTDEISQVTEEMCSPQRYAERYPENIKTRRKNESISLRINTESWIQTCSKHETSCMRNFTDGSMHGNILASNYGSDGLIVKFEARQQKGCYGYVIFINSSREGAMKYEEETVHQNENQAILVNFDFPYGAEVLIELIEIPSGRKESLPKFVLPDKCTSDVAHYILLHSCHTVSNSSSLSLVIAKDLCDAFKTYNLALPMIDGRVKQYCTKAIKATNSKNSEKDKNDATVVVLAMFGGLFVALSLMLFGCYYWVLKKRCIKRYFDKHKHMKHKPPPHGNIGDGEKRYAREEKGQEPAIVAGDDVVVDLEEENVKGKDQIEREDLVRFSSRPKRITNPKVMILNRPGCELLETLLRDLAFILKSYGAEVHLSLLEQSQLDAAGGISSYLQNNIDTCDFILIMFSVGSEDQIMSLHKPYDFALKVIRGLMYHENDTSRYVMMYTDPFKTAMHYIPSVFHATQDYGYRIPKDLSKLIDKLCGGGGMSEEQRRERDLKNKLFVNRMKSTVKKMQNASHQRCYKNKCSKGHLYHSIGNLSSLWATTVHSKSASLLSLPKANDAANICKDGDEQCPLLRTEQWAAEACQQPEESDEKLTK